MTFKIQKVQKWQTPFWNPYQKPDEILCAVTFLLLNKKVEKFQLCLKTAASLFPFSFVIFLIIRKPAFTPT
jgi:hypothetical protein